MKNVTNHNVFIQTINEIKRELIEKRKVHRFS